MSAKFHILEDVRFSNGILSIEIADLNTGMPDGLVGLPLVVTEQSQRYLVQFPAIAGFRSVPEPLNGLSDSSKEVYPFLFLEMDSEYLRECANDAKYFVYGSERPENPSIRHYVVYGENTVIHVLSATEPHVTSPYSSA